LRAADLELFLPIADAGSFNVKGESMLIVRLVKKALWDKERPRALHVDLYLTGVQ